MATKTPEASLIEQVLAEISNDRRRAHEDLRGVQVDMQAHLETVNAENKGVVEAAEAAEADLRAHKRFETRLKKAEYDARQRLLERANNDAQAALRAARRKAESDIAPLQQRLEAANNLCRDLAREWQAHLRVAKASGANLDAHWTPEKGDPKVPA